MVTYSVPMRTRFRQITRREGMLVRGAAGWGEFSPFLEYDDATSLPWWRAAREAAEEGFPAPLRTRIPVNVTIPATDPELAHRLVIESAGCTTAKVKVAQPGQTLAAELARLEAVRDGLGPAGRIRIDANAAWDLDEAKRRLPLLNKAAGGLEYAEQPCATVAELAALRRSVDIPIAADESIRRAEDPFEVARAQAADVVVLKVQPLGGVRAALDIANRIDIPAVVSSAIESSVGIRAGLALAAALPKLDYACGLATTQLLVADVTQEPLTVSEGAIELRDIAPDQAAMAAAAASSERDDFWRRRAGRVQELDLSHAPDDRLLRRLGEQER